MASFLIPASAITLLLLFLFSPIHAAVVLDADGDYLVNGASYYIVPDMVGTGGLTWAPNNSTLPCPLFVKQAVLDKEGTSATAARIYSTVRLPFIVEKAPIFISFDGVDTPCLEPLNWWVTTDVESGHLYTAAGIANSLGDKFIFEETESKMESKHVYKMSYCYQHAMECFDIGMVNELLGINSDDPLPVKFFKRSSDVPPQLASIV